jgi:hypothetical protein
VVLIALAAPFVSFGLSVVFPALRHPIVLALAPMMAVLAYEARRQPWRPSRALTKWEIVLIAAVIAIVGVFFLVSPSYFARVL